jgi:hypothetical protein
MNENRRRTGLMDQQDKPKTGKKGQRGQDEGIRSKRSTTLKVASSAKKPGRQKQTARGKIAKIKRLRSDTQ